MRPSWITACLLLLFCLSPLYPQSEPNRAYPVDDRVFFIEEIFTFAGNYLFSESSSVEEAFSGEDFLNEEDSIVEETSSSEEIIRREETQTIAASGGETLPSGAEFSGDEIIPGEETISGETASAAGEDFLLDDTYTDDYAYLFEAPPLIFEAQTFENRSLYTLFPNFTERQRRSIRNNQVIRSSFTKGEAPTLVPNPDLEINLLGTILRKDPSHLIEALLVVPYNEKELDLLDIYNALGRISNIKDCAVLLRGNDYFIFTESTRIDNTRNRRAISDPAPATFLPFSETMYLRLKEINFGNLFIRGDISISTYGITYSMTNFTDIRYFLVPLMRAERYSTIIYLEPVKEGVLIYSMTGFYLPGFIADRVNLTPNINRRIDVFIKWITEGLRIQESAVR